MQILAQSSKNPYFSYSLDAIGEAKWFCWSLNAYPLKRPSYPLWTELQAIFFEWWCRFPRETTDLWMQRINVPSQGCLSAQRHFSVLSSHVHTPSFYVHRFQDWKCHRCFTLPVNDEACYKGWSDYKNSWECPAHKKVFCPFCYIQDPLKCNNSEFRQSAL